MHVLSSQIHSMKLRKEHKKKTRTALHMLALSGVVRPSHVELRFTTPITNIMAFRAQSLATEHQLIQPVPLRSWEPNATSTMNQTWQWVRSLSSAFVHLAKKPIVLQWNKQLDV